MKTIKIAKFLSEAGIASRRKSETLVRQGLIFVNGKTMVDPARRVDPITDKVAYKGKTGCSRRISLLSAQTSLSVTLLRTDDPHAANLVTELVPASPKVWPVGRLDKYTSGLLILTNDGELVQRLTHPKFEIEKEYEIVTNIPLTATDIALIRRGMRLEDGFIKPDRFEVAGAKLYRVIIHSGKNASSAVLSKKPANLSRG